MALVSSPSDLLYTYFFNATDAKGAKAARINSVSCARSVSCVGIFVCRKCRIIPANYLEIIDTGGLSMAMLSIAAWSSIVIDKENEEGYERTSKLDGYKCFEKFRKNGGTSELAVIVEDRFLVTASKSTEKEKEIDAMKKNGQRHEPF